MKQFPPIPNAGNAPDELFEGGHLWIQELLDGGRLRFQLQNTGVIRFGDQNSVFDSGDIPEPFGHAVRHVRERLDREALRAAVDDVESVVFFGESMHRHTIEYDWSRTPSFLGFDVWSADRESFLSPDAVQQIYERLGLQVVNTFEQEVRAIHFDPESYEIPESNWYDGPAAGVVFRNKRGGRAKIVRPEFETVDDGEPVGASAGELASQYVTYSRLTTVARKLSNQGHPITVDAVYERAVEGVIREHHRQLFHGASDVDMGELHSEIAALVQNFLNEWDEQ